MSKSWLDSVGTGLDTDMEGDAKLSSDASVRFWMPGGSDRSIIFLTDGGESKTIWEHQLRLGGHYRNWFTCMKMVGEGCKICDFADAHSFGYRYKIQVFTVIDLHEFTDRAGKKHKNLKKVLCAKKDTTEILSRKWGARVEMDQGLKGAKFKVYRGADTKSASVGTDFEFVEMVDLAKLPDSTEIDYSEVFKPDEERVERAVSALAASVAEKGKGIEGGDSVIPFD